MSTGSEMVTAVGNSWIICRSKSYAGRIYYFNTLTGEAAWNLSESEIEKAKKRTSMLESQTGFQIDNCPEPIDSPQDQINQLPSHSKTQQQFPNVVPSKVYTKQIINNKFPRSSYLYPTQFPLSSLNPVQFNIPNSSAVTPSMWNVAPQAIFVTPTALNQHPVMNKTFNHHDYVPVTNTSVSLSTRFKNIGESKTTAILSQNKSKMKIGLTFPHSRKNNCRKLFQNSNGKIDLRLLLSSKKNIKSNINDIEDDQHFDVNASHIQSTDKRKRNFLSLYDIYEDDEIWLGENLRKHNYNESLDLSLVKKLLHIKNNFEVWYIVFDSNVLLNNINFINILVNSDNQCRLMVPQIVLDKIQMATKSRLRTQAYKAAYFVSQQIDANVAIMDKDSEEENADNTEIIINCCTKLTDQGYPVVLLTDDIELNVLKNNTRFLVFTVRELKKILSKTVSQDPTKNSDEEIVLNQSRNIKITIANNVNNNLKEEETNSNAIAYSGEVYFEENKIKSSEDNESDSIQMKEIYKNVDDVGVQTCTAELDTVYENKDKLCSMFSNINQNKICKTKEVPVTSKSCNNIHTLLNITRAKKIKGKKSRAQSCLAINLNHSKDKKTEQRKATSETLMSLYKNFPNVLFYGSSESLQHNYEDNCEASSEAHRNINENFKSEETSSSEKSYNSNSYNTKDSQNLCNKNNVNDDKHVMFEITSNSMEECLSRKCDEWISRFVQIIEEVTTQILHQDPPFILDVMPPPWTIYEATECIKRKFPKDDDVVDASNKLLNILFEIGGLRGKIKIDITPNKYMEMYSYGVYLIDALQGLLTNSEDLQVAAESLSKLLSDIQDSHLCPDNQDSFNDSEIVVDVNEEKMSHDEDITKISSPENIESVNNNEKQFTQVKKRSPVKKTKSESTLTSSVNYNLRSHRKKLLQEREELSEAVTFVRNIDLESSFFTSLHLKKNLVTNDDIVPGLNKPSSNNEDSAEKKDEFVKTNTENNCNSDSKINENFDINEPEEKSTNEPKIVRNFTRCVEFENKLKSKLMEQNLVYDSWTYKNDKYQNETENEELDYSLMDDQYYCDDYDYEMSDLEEMSEINSYKTGIESEDHIEHSEKKANIHFKEVIEKVEHNIREAFAAVHRFCEKCYNTLNLEGCNTEIKEMQNKAEQTYSYLSNLCDAFNSILTRETSNSSFKMQELLKMDELEAIIVEDEDLEAYRNFINKCIEQGNILKDSVQLVINASGQ